jgi:hypothetical protein
MKTQGASGPDNISPPLLKNLGPKALAKLLDLFNFSLETANTLKYGKMLTLSRY